MFVDGDSQRTVQSQVHRTAPVRLLFQAIGVMAGLFGIDAGWPNVQALSLLKGLGTWA